MTGTITLLILLASVLSPAQVLAVESDDLARIINYKQYSELLSSAGQPKPSQFKTLKNAGFERVIFLAFTDHDESVANEDRVVSELGLEYIQIPVIWENPTRDDFSSFASVMNQNRASRTLIHCQVNYRASAFSFLYRVLYEDVPMGLAKSDMNTVWVPNKTWRDFIFTVLEENGRSPECDDCLWDVE